MFYVLLFIGFFMDKTTAMIPKIRLLHKGISMMTKMDGLKKGIAMIPEKELKEIERMNDKVFSCNSNIEIPLEEGCKTILPNYFISDVGPMPIEFYYCAKLVVEKKYEQAITALKQYKGPYPPLLLDIKSNELKKIHENNNLILEKNYIIDNVNFSVQDYEYTLFLSYLWWNFGYPILELSDSEF